jgi:hypothetical protein
MWMELGLFGMAGMIPVVVIIAIFEKIVRNRARNSKPLDTTKEWVASRDLQAPR